MAGYVFLKLNDGEELHHLHAAATTSSLPMISL